MTSTSYSDSPRSVLKSVGGQDYRFTPTYLRNRDPITPATSPDIKPKEQQGRYPINSLWNNTSNGNTWLLLKYNNDGGTNKENTALWILITTGGIGPLLMLTGDDGVAVSPTVGGVINLQGLVVANGTHAKAIFTESPSINTEKIDVQLSAAIAATDVTKVGLAAFNNTEFTVDANGFVSLVGGGAALEQLTGDDSLAVVPFNGNINLTGTVVANATHAKALFFKKNATSTEELDLQLSAAIAATDVTKVGLSNFNNTQFTVDANGFVQFLHTPFSKVARQVFSNTGTYTPTTGMVFCDIEVIGGGGGGGGCALTAGGQGAAGAGGGAGGYARGIFTAAAIGGSQAVTIGAAGTGGAAGANPGNTGGTSSVGILISASGGLGGTGGAATAAAITSPPGIGGSGTGGDFQTFGGVGEVGIVSSTGLATVGGFGGSSFFGGGAASSATSAGNGGFSFGGGGGGASNAPGSGVGLAGGNGSKGGVMITEYIFG